MKTVIMAGSRGTRIFSVSSDIFQADDKNRRKAYSEA
jgi:GTP:adenosylcobinamide-phosphate guanylyltransferase